MKISMDVQQAIRFFAESLISGDFGADDSRDGRSDLFLKDCGVVDQAMAIFLYHLDLDDEGRVLNHDEAEQRVRQYIRWQIDPRESPDPPFQDDELGIM